MIYGRKRVLFSLTKEEMKWTQLEDITLSKIIQTKKNISYSSLYVRAKIFKNMPEMSVCIAASMCL